MNDVSYFRGSHNPLNAFRSLHFDSLFYQKNPTYFHPDGIWVFCGAQGNGKTLSAVKCLKSLVCEYPKVLVCSNLQINGLSVPVVPFTHYSQLTDLSNGVEGIIFLIDEIHVLWNSLESKNISLAEIAAFCQMRKERRIILGTSQVYSRIAKPIREQLKYVILCNSILKYLQINRIVDPNAEGYSGEHDGECDGKLLSTQWFFHSPEDYQSYNTLAKIERAKR